MPESSAGDRKINKNKKMAREEGQEERKRDKGEKEISDGRERGREKERVLDSDSAGRRVSSLVCREVSKYERERERIYMCEEKGVTGRESEKG